MQIILTIIITILLFGILIFIHEFGHFITAKWAKVKINEFSLGMGPAVLKKQFGETQYSLRLFPIGGFVQMDGEDGNGTDENSFNMKPKWKRFIILIAGAFNNIVFGFLLICLVFAIMSGIKLFPTTQIAEFDKNATSVKLGLKEQDVIHTVNGYRVYTYTDLSYALTKDGTKPLDFTVVRDGKKIEIDNITLPTETSKVAGEYFVPDFKVYGEQKTVWSTIKYSFNSTISLSRSIYSFLGSLITGGGNLNNVTGPVGTTQVIGESVSTEKGIDYGSLFLMMAMISINLGIMNLLPFPALDGGRIFLLIYEAVFRRKMSEKIEMAINSIGFIILMVLMVLIAVKDIVNLF